MAKRFKKRSLRIIAALLILAMTFASCSSAADTGETVAPATPESTTTEGDDDGAPEEDSGDDMAVSGTLRLVGPAIFAAESETTDPVTGQVVPGYDQIIAMAKEEFPDLEVKIEVTPWDSWQAKLQTTAAGGLADILLHGASIVDVVEDLTPYFEKDPEFAEMLYVPSAIRRTDESDYTKLSITGVPIEVAPSMIIYDKQLFDDFGVEYPTEDYTWDDLLSMAEQLTGTNPNTGEQNYGIFIGTSAIDTWKPFFCYNYAKGIHTFEFVEDKFAAEILFDTPEVVAAFEYFDALAKTSPQGFLEGKGNEKFLTAENDVAINFGSAMASYNKAVAGGLEDRFEIIPYPIVENGEGRSTFVGDSNMAIPTTSENKDGAWEFIKWMATDVGVAEWLVQSNKIPNSVEGISMLEQFPFQDMVMDSMENYPANFFYASSEYYDNLYGPAESIFGNNITAMYADAATPQECATGMQNEFVEYRNNNQ